MSAGKNTIIALPFTDAYDGAGNLRPSIESAPFRPNAEPPSLPSEPPRDTPPQLCVRVRRGILERGEATERGTLNSATDTCEASWSWRSGQKCQCYAPSVGLKYVQRPSAHSSARSVVNLKAPRVDLSSPISVSVERKPLLRTFCAV